MPVRTRRLALTEGIIAGVLFGTTAIFIRFLQALDAFSIAFWRLVVACLVLALAQFFLRKLFSFELIRRNFKELLILSFLLGFHFILFISAVKDTTILNATLLVNTAPIFSTFISSFVYKLNPSRLAVVGLILSFTGVCVIAYAENAMANTNVSLNGFSPSLKGDLEALLAALVEAFYLNYGRKIRNQMDIVPTMFTMYLLTAIIVGVLGISTANTTLKLPTTETIFMLVGLGLLPTATAHTLYFSSLSSLKSFETATMALIEPVGSTLLGVILFQEIPPYLFVFGAALVLLGVLFVVKGEG